MRVSSSSAVDLVRRLLDADFRRSVKTLDEAENVYTILREAGAGDGDTVSRPPDTHLLYAPSKTDCRYDHHPRRFWTLRSLCSSRSSRRMSEVWIRSSVDEGPTALTSLARCSVVARMGSHSSEQLLVARSSGAKIVQLSTW